MPKRTPLKGTFFCKCILCKQIDPAGCQIPWAERDSHLALAYNTSWAQSPSATAVRPQHRPKASNLRSTPQVPSSGASSSSKLPDTGVPKTLKKREENKATAKAHARLATIERICASASARLNASPNLETLIEAEASLQTASAMFGKVARDVPSVNDRRKACRPAIVELEAQVKALQGLHPLAALFINTDHYFTASDSFKNLFGVAQVVLFIAVLSSVVMGVSRRMGDVLIRLVKIAIKWAFRVGGSVEGVHPSFEQERILKQIPMTLETALKQLNVNSDRTVTFAVCPDCHANYEPSSSKDPGAAKYPSRCTNKDLNGKVCDTELQANGKPLKTFVYHDFHDFLARLLSRPDIEAVMDDACDIAMDDIKEGSSPRFLSDVFDGSYIRSFKGPQSDRLFIDRPDTEGRYLFAFNCDFFQPDGSTHRGASASCGIICAACVNLPLDLRYKPENMYIAGVIPGPDKPSGEKLNHYLEHVVHALEVSWKRGVRYSRTANYPKGRDTRSAMILAVCDLPGGRQFAQCADHSAHHYCARCYCYGRDTLNRTDLDDDAWQVKPADVLREQAEAWKVARTNVERNRLFAEHGIRWSVLWKLPYWDPANMLVTDPMHCLYEGLARYMVRDVLKLTRESMAASPVAIPSFDYEFTFPLHSPEWTSEDINTLRLIHKDLRTALVPWNNDEMETPVDPAQKIEDLQKKLLNRNRKYLNYVFDSLERDDLRKEVAGKNKKLTKSQYAAALCKWRQEWPEKPKSEPPLKYAGANVMDRIIEVIRDTDTPSWLPSVPFNFGDPAAGSPKADEWRTMSTVYLPIALVSVWGEGTEHESPSIGARFRTVLDHTMCLFSAITLASMRTQTTARMDSYLFNMKKWLADLKVIHPTIKTANHRTNWHMAMHIYEFLQLFGPVRGWWTFPFERLIGHIQRITTNYKFGQREATMLRTFIREAKLQFWLSSPSCPQVIHECAAVFRDVYESSERHDIPEQDTASKTAFRELPSDLQSIIQDLQVSLVARFVEDNTVYSRRDTHIGNSLILFRVDGKGPLIPGSIKYIIEKPASGETLFAVNRQVPLDKGLIIDPYRHYPAIPAKMYSATLSSTLELVDPSWIESHYARWKMDNTSCVVLNLSRD